MACFVVPAAEAIVVTIITRVVMKKQANDHAPNAACDAVTFDALAKIPFARKLKWLSNLLWGGSVLLAFEHLWHGEIVAWFPFLTAAQSPADAAIMLHEMATVGVAMALLVTLVWVAMLIVTSMMTRKIKTAQPAGK